MTKCYIIDDELHAIETLKGYIEKIPELELIGTAQNPLIGFNEVLTKNADITFLDVDMPELSGLEVADLISKNTAIIFTTAFSNYAVEVFEKNVADFLLKPISFEKFIKAINRVKTKLQSMQVVKPITDVKEENDYIFINPGIKGKMTKIYLKDITYIEGLQNYILIYTDDNKYLTYLTMKEIEAGIGNKYFKRIHKSYIVNLEKITSVERGKVIIKPKIELNIGLMYKEAFFEQIRSKTINSGRVLGSGFSPGDEG
jgi:two-component system LytT family response regulator